MTGLFRGLYLDRDSGQRLDEEIQNPRIARIDLFTLDFIRETSLEVTDNIAMLYYSTYLAKPVAYDNEHGPEMKQYMKQFIADSISYRLKRIMTNWASDASTTPGRLRGMSSVSHDALCRLIRCRTPRTLETFEIFNETVSQLRNSIFRDVSVFGDNRGSGAPVHSKDYIYMSVDERERLIEATQWGIRVLSYGAPAASQADRLKMWSIDNQIGFERYIDCICNLLQCVVLLQTENDLVPQDTDEAIQQMVECRRNLHAFQVSRMFRKLDPHSAIVTFPELYRYPFLEDDKYALSSCNSEKTVRFICCLLERAAHLPDPSMGRWDK